MQSFDPPTHTLSFEAHLEKGDELAVRLAQDVAVLGELPASHAEGRQPLLQLHLHPQLCPCLQHNTCFCLFVSPIVPIVEIYEINMKEISYMLYNKISVSVKYGHVCDVKMRRRILCRLFSWNIEERGYDIFHKKKKDIKPGYFSHYFYFFSSLRTYSIFFNIKSDLENLTFQNRKENKKKLFELSLIVHKYFLRIFSFSSFKAGY
jgi:hypothetical protein